MVSFLLMDLAPGIVEATTRTKKTLGFKGSAELDTAIKKFGTSSLSNGTDSYPQMSANDDFGFQQGDFTIEIWLYAQSVTGTQTLFDMRAGIANDIPFTCF